MSATPFRNPFLLGRAGPAAALFLVPAAARVRWDELTRTFGLVRDAPDEFTVTTRAPLSMPPDMTLRAPRPGAIRPQELTQRQAAEAGPGSRRRAEHHRGGPSSPGQQALVAAAGGPVSGDIRARVDAEAALDRPSRELTEALMFWRDPPPPGTVVDPGAREPAPAPERRPGPAQHLRRHSIIQRKRQGFFSSIF